MEKPVFLDISTHPIPCEYSSDTIFVFSESRETGQCLILDSSGTEFQLRVLHDGHLTGFCLVLENHE